MKQNEVWVVLPQKLVEIVNEKLSEVGIGWPSTEESEFMVEMFPKPNASSCLRIRHRNEGDLREKCKELQSVLEGDGRLGIKSAAGFLFVSQRETGPVYGEIELFLVRT